MKSLLVNGEGANASSRIRLATCDAFHTENAQERNSRGLEAPIQLAVDRLVWNRFACRRRDPQFAVRSPLQRDEPVG